MVEQWINAGGAWLNLAAIVRVMPLTHGCRVHFVDGSSEWLQGAVATELLRAVSKGDARG